MTPLQLIRPYYYIVYFSMYTIHFTVIPNLGIVVKCIEVNEDS